MSTNLQNAIDKYKQIEDDFIKSTEARYNDKSYAKGKKMRTGKNMEQISLRALF
ncbi:hypothetical protein [Campylobacter curvus]|uniref:hypothetical protein n=1 Tax=Campylobacter curvus TaxID=200 RepID=UPI0019D0A555|nr:hypothetical protein [Campylobacter curvus]MBN7287882.1 hypothetical protein [Campylobacter curvus]